MKWLVFSYSMPSKTSTKSRVRIWRKLKKLGTVSPKSGVYVLPFNEERLEAFRWLTSEVEQERGDALTMAVERFDNLSDDNVIDIFRKERLADYYNIESGVETLERAIHAVKSKDNVVALKRDLNKVKKEIDAISSIDFFPAYDKATLLERLRKLQKSIIASNLIVLLLFSAVTLNSMVLTRMREEAPYGKSEPAIEAEFEYTPSRL